MKGFTPYVIQALKVANEQYKREGFVPTLDLLIEDLEKNNV